MPAVWREFCLPLQGQTRHSCDGQWHQSFPHQTRCHIHCPAPSGGHLCNKRRALIQENITVSYLMLQPKLQINWPISELAATSTFPPPSMKDVIVSTLMFPPKSTGGKNRKLFLIHWDNDDACNYIVDFEEKKKREIYLQLMAQRWSNGHTRTGRIWSETGRDHQRSWMWCQSHDLKREIQYQLHWHMSCTFAVIASAACHSSPYTYMICINSS